MRDTRDCTIDMRVYIALCRPFKWSVTVAKNDWSIPRGTIEQGHRGLLSDDPSLTSVIRSNASYRWDSSGRKGLHKVSLVSPAFPFSERRNARHHDPWCQPLRCPSNQSRRCSATNSMTSPVSRPSSLSLSVAAAPSSPMETSSRETLAAVSRVRRHRNRQEPDSRRPNRGKCECVVGTNPSPPYKAAPVGSSCSYAALSVSVGYYVNHRERLRCNLMPGLCVCVCVCAGSVRFLTLLTCEKKLWEKTARRRPIVRDDKPSLETRGRKRNPVERFTVDRSCGLFGKREFAKASIIAALSKLQDGRGGGKTSADTRKRIDVWICRRPWKRAFDDSMTEHPAEGFREGRREWTISIDRCNASRESGNAIRSGITAELYSPRAVNAR